MICQYCKKEASFWKNSTYLYGKDYGPIWICEDCNAYVGCHPGTNRPLGSLANKELRILRMRAHEVFDPLWKNGILRRREAYKFLKQSLGIENKRDCHIGKFNEAQCLSVILLLKDSVAIENYIKKLELRMCND